MVKRFINFLTSLKFGIILFLIIALYSIIGTLIPQGMSMDFYLQEYSSFGSLMIFLQFDKVYNSYIYLAIVLVFTINLVGCTLKILPSQLNRMKDTYLPKIGDKATNLYEEGMDSEDIKEILKKKKYTFHDTGDGFYAAKHRLGHLGSSVTHLGIIVIILGSIIGNRFVKEGFISLAPGEIHDFSEYGFSLELNDFYMDIREDGSVDQYYSELTLYEDGKQARQETIWVNNPLNLNGMYFYQSNYGWASKMQVKCLEGHLHQEYIFKGNSHEFYTPENLMIYLYGYYPDLRLDKQGNPFSASQEKNNPGYAVILYDEKGYVDAYVVEEGDAIQYNEITIEFVDSVLYTGLTYRQDFGYYPVLIGSIILTLGILLSFYFYPKYILFSANSIIPVTRQNVWGYTMKVKEILEKLYRDREEE